MSALASIITPWLLRDRQRGVTARNGAEELVRKKADSGRYTSASEVVREALRLLDEEWQALKRIRLSALARDDLDEIWLSIAPDNMPAAKEGPMN